MLINKDSSDGLEGGSKGKRINMFKVKTARKDQLFGAREQARANKLQMPKDANA